MYNPDVTIFGIFLTIIIIALMIFILKKSLNNPENFTAADIFGILFISALGISLSIVMIIHGYIGMLK